MQITTLLFVVQLLLIGNISCAFPESPNENRKRTLQEDEEIFVPEKRPRDEFKNDVLTAARALAKDELMELISPLDSLPLSFDSIIAEFLAGGEIEPLKYTFDA